jgi:hypothetical protein
MKFKSGDKIRTTKNLTGKIDKTSFNSMLQDWEYYVIWDHMPGLYPTKYSEAEGDSEWTLIEQDLATGMLTPWSHSTYCTHEYVDCGFQFTKMVCKKCNKLKEGQ